MTKISLLDQAVQSGLISYYQYQLALLATQPLAEHSDTVCAAARWLILHLDAMSLQSGSIACDATTVADDITQWLGSDKDIVADELIQQVQHLLTHHVQQLYYHCPTFCSQDAQAHALTPVHIKNGQFVYLQKNWIYEQQFWQLCTQKLFPMVQQQQYNLSAAIPHLPQFFDRFADTLSPQVIDAIQVLHQRDVLFLTGGPGYGKTTALGMILRALIDSSQHCHLPDPKIILLAPTGRAQSRMCESLASLTHTRQDGHTYWQIPTQGTTLHTALQILKHPTPQQQSFYPLVADIIAIDEASMIDIHMFTHLLAALPPQCKLIILGDANQLPSVGAGHIFADLLQDATQPKHILHHSVVYLTKCYRLNKIISDLSKQILAGQSDAFAPFVDTTPLPLLHQLKGVHVRSLALYKTATYHQIIHWLAMAFTLPYDAWRIPLPTQKDHWISADYEYITKIFDHYQQFCVLVARRERGWYSAEKLNQALKVYLKTPSNSLEFYHTMPIMVNRNLPQHQLYNGDRGIIIQGGDILYACFPLNANKIVPLSLISHVLVPSYALTIHKSQGSEYDKIAIIIDDQHSALLNRQLLYTALTRAKSTAVVWSSLDSLAHGIASPLQRLSGFAYDLLPPPNLSNSHMADSQNLLHF